MFFVEYKLTPEDAGYCPPEQSLGIRQFSRHIDGYPNPVYGGRRITEFEVESDAKKLVERFPRLFGFAHDLLTEREQNGIDQRVAATLSPILDRLTDLEETVAELKASAARPNPQVNPKPKAK